MPNTPAPPHRVAFVQSPNRARQPRKRGRGLMISAIITIVLGLAAVVSAVQLLRPLPAVAAITSLPASYTIPGAAPKIPWPTTGQASIEVLGVGSLGSSGTQTPKPIASTAKIMTAYVVLKDHPLAGGEDGPAITITAADVADYQADVAANDSAARVTLGEKLSERAALEALMIPSADNIARKLATWDAGTKAAFLDKMNATAASLGMTKTHYTDASGLEATTTSTAVDQVKLAEKAIAMPAFAEIVAMKSATLPVAGKVKNYNALLGKYGVFGIKTGSTSAAGGCLVFAAHRTYAGHTYTIIGAVLGQGVNGPFVDVLPKVMAASSKVITAAGAALKTYPVVRSGQSVGSLRGPLGSGTAVLAGTDLGVVGWPGLTYQLKVQVATPRHASAGAALGTIQASGHLTTASASAVAKDQMAPPGLWKRLTRH
jgi:serine-type D-Ala-D-Ala carboxypeptidase (penicillin-binding protein 5/6)